MSRRSSNTWKRVPEPGRPSASDNAWPKDYRCVYCGWRTADHTKLPQHEISCPMKEMKRREWQGEIDRAKRREAREEELNRRIAASKNRS